MSLLWEIIVLVAAVINVALGCYWYRRALKAERSLSEWRTYGAEVIELRRRLARALRGGH